MSEDEYTHKQFLETDIISQIRKWNDKYDEACLRILNDIENEKIDKIDKDNKNRV